LFVWKIEKRKSKIGIQSHFPLSIFHFLTTNTDVGAIMFPKKPNPPLDATVNGK